MSINMNELTKVRSLLAEALAKKGEDYLYEMPQEAFTGPDGDPYWDDAGACHYVAAVVQDGEQVGLEESCLWGHVLVGWGVALEDLLPVNDMGINQIPVPWTDPIITVAAKASQQAQDRDQPWGEAVQVFEDTIKEGLQA